jgi:hypothetical protein
MTEPYYSSLSQADLDTLTELVVRKGYGEVLRALADILTQGINEPELSLALGLAAGTAKRLGV